MVKVVYRDKKEMNFSNQSYGLDSGAASTNGAFFTETYGNIFKTGREWAGLRHSTNDKRPEEL